MASVGTILRSARESQGRALAGIADDLCITQRYLRAIEEDDLASLPGAFFYKSFVKQYAAIVGVDVAELRSGIEALTAAQEEAPILGQVARLETPVREPDPFVAASNRYFSDRRLGLSVVGLATVLLACSGFYAWWIRPAQTVAAEPQTQPAVIQPVTAQAPAPAPEVTEIAQTSPAPELNIAATTGSDGVNRVVLNLSATEKTWLSVTSGGKRIFSGILEPSQTKTLTGLEAGKMMVGNAGGIEVRLNGKQVGPIGKSGQVRVLVFTPDDFEILPVAPPPPSESL